MILVLLGSACGGSSSSELEASKQRIAATTAAASATTAAPTTTAASATTAAPTTTLPSERPPSYPSADPDLCKLADHRGIDGFSYEELMVSGVDYTNRNTDLDRGMVHLNPQYSHGFPLPEGMLPSTGTLGVAFLAIDFTDSPGSDNQLTEIQRVAKELNEYWAFQSGGKFQMDFRFGDRVFHVPKDSAIYGLQSSPAPTRELTAEVLQIADPFVDLTGVEWCSC